MPVVWRWYGCGSSMAVILVVWWCMVVLVLRCGELWGVLVRRLGTLRCCGVVVVMCGDCVMKAVVGVRRRCGMVCRGALRCCVSDYCGVMVVMCGDSVKAVVGACWCYGMVCCGALRCCVSGYCGVVVVMCGDGAVKAVVGVRRHGGVVVQWYVGVTACGNFGCMWCCGDVVTCCGLCWWVAVVWRRARFQLLWRYVVLWCCGSEWRAVRHFLLVAGQPSHTDHKLLFSGGR